MKSIVGTMVGALVAMFSFLVESSIKEEVARWLGDVSSKSFHKLMLVSEFKAIIVGILCAKSAEVTSSD